MEDFAENHSEEREVGSEYSGTEVGDPWPGAKMRKQHGDENTRGDRDCTAGDRDGEPCAAQQTRDRI